MGFFDEIKKVIFGAKSVTKSAAEKAMDKGREIGSDAMEKMEDIGSDLKDKAEDVWEKAVDSSEELGEKVLEKTGDVFESAKEFAEDIGEKVIDKGSDFLDKTKEVAEDIGSKVMDKTEDVVNLAKEVTGLGDDNSSDVENNLHDIPSDVADAGSDIVDQVVDDLSEKGTETTTEGLGAAATGAGIAVSSADRIVEGTKDIAENIGEKVLDAKADLIDKAKELTGDLGNKLDETLEKAEKLTAEDAIKPAFKEPSEILDKDLLEDKDDFFKKAEAFADGRYEEVTDPFAKPKITRVEEVIEETESAADPLPGFEDLDGDGSEIVDDAIIDED